MNILGKDAWDSNSIEAQFHKRIKFLTKRQQGYVMGAFRDVMRQLVTTQTSSEPIPPSEVFAYAAKQVEDELHAACKIMGVDNA